MTKSVCSPAAGRAVRRSFIDGSSGSPRKEFGGYVVDGSSGTPRKAPGGSSVEGSIETPRKAIGGVALPRNKILLPAQLFPWLSRKASKSDEYKNIHLSPEEIVNKHGVPRKVLLHCLQREIHQEKLFSSLPFALLFTAAFAGMVIIHDDASLIRAVEEGVLHDVDTCQWAKDTEWIGFKTSMDVNTVQDFYAWARTAFLPRFFEQTYTFSEDWDPEQDLEMARMMVDIPFKDRGVLLQYNRLVGGIRFRQEVSAEESCSFPREEMAEFFNSSCYGDAYPHDPDFREARTTRAPERVQWFLSKFDLAALQEQLDTMETTGWIDRRTQKIEVAMPIYNAEFGLHSLITLNFFLSRGGRIWKRHVPLSAYAEWYTYSYYLVWDGIFVACVARLFYSEVAEIIWIVKDVGFTNLWERYFQGKALLSNVVDWVTIAGGVCVVALATFSFTGTADLNYRANMITWNDNATVYPEDYDRYVGEVESYIAQLEMVVEYINTLSHCIAAYPFVLLLLVLKTFGAQAKLAQVNNTMANSAVDLFHFMIIYLSVASGSALSGMLLFGDKIEEFSSFPRSSNAVFRCIMGDFDWDDLRQVGNVEGFIWLACTIVCCNLLLMNMLISITIDSYTFVHKRSANAHNLWVEVALVVKRAFGTYKKQLLPITVIEKVLRTSEIESQVRCNKLATDLTSVEDGEDNPRSIVGRGTKAVVGMKVLPRDHDIESFVGVGIIRQVDEERQVCEVQHFSGRTMNYDIGFNLQYSLKLAPGVEAVPNSIHNTQGWFVLTPDRLIRMMKESNYSLSRGQANSLLEKCVHNYYAEHVGHFSRSDLKRKIVHAHWRAGVISSDVNKVGSSKSEEYGREMQCIRKELVKIFTDLQGLRQDVVNRVLEHRNSVEWFRRRMLRMSPDEMERIMCLGPAQRRDDNLVGAGDRGEPLGARGDGQAALSVVSRKFSQGSLPRNDDNGLPTSWNATSLSADRDLEATKTDTLKLTKFYRLLHPSAEPVDPESGFSQITAQTLPTRRPDRSTIRVMRKRRKKSVNRSSRSAPPAKEKNASLRLSSVLGGGLRSALVGTFRSLSAAGHRLTVRRSTEMDKPAAHRDSRSSGSRVASEESRPEWSSGDELGRRSRGGSFSSRPSSDSFEHVAHDNEGKLSRPLPAARTELEVPSPAEPVTSRGSLSSQMDGSGGSDPEEGQVQLVVAVPEASPATDPPLDIAPAASEGSHLSDGDSVFSVDTKNDHFLAQIDRQLKKCEELRNAIFDEDVPGLPHVPKAEERTPRVMRALQPAPVVATQGISPKSSHSPSRPLPPSLHEEFMRRTEKLAPWT